MKNHLILFSATLLAIALFANPAQSQVYVRVRPSPPVVIVERPAPPSPVHVWIEPEWRYRHGSYVYVEGRWARPRHGRVWIGGHWDEGPRGYGWIPGHWARR